MAGKLDRFTRSARNVLTMANAEATRLNHAAIGPEHFLLALARETTSLAGQVLRELGVEADRLSSAVEQSVEPGATPLDHKPPLSPTSQKLIELSVDEARRLGHSYIGTEHLLLGLIRQGQSPAINALLALGVDLNRVRIEIARNILPVPPPARQAAAQAWAEPELPPAVLTALPFDLTQEADDGKLDPLIGRQAILARILQILGRRTKNSLILVGEPGVGKKAIVRGLAQLMSDGQVPPPLWQRRLLVLDAANLVTSIIYAELVQQRLRQVVEEGAASTSILFIDNIHRIINAAGTGIEVANIIKAALSRGELQVIGATTPNACRKYINAEIAHEWAINLIDVSEPSAPETLQILRGLKSRYEEHHHLQIEDEALDAAAHLAARYVADRFLPAKAIDLIDETSSRVRIQTLPDAPELRATYRRLRQVKRQKQAAVDAQHSEQVAQLQQRQQELEAQLKELLAAIQPVLQQAKVTLEDVAEVISQWTGMPAEQLVVEERSRLRGK